MGEGRGWGSTVLGWFIVRDETAEQAAGDAPQATDQGLMAGEASGGATTAATADVPADLFQSEPPAPTAGGIDFDGVFEAAGISADERQRVAKAGELLASLPAETPVAVRKQIVEASLRAFGVPIEKIIETGVGEIQALEGYIRRGAADTQKVLDESSRRIELYENEIKNLRMVMEQRVQEQQGVTAGCNGKKLEVQRILEFFGQEAVAKVVRESPKLVDPSAPAGPAA
jgi:hypothetical protein